MASAVNLTTPSGMTFASLLANNFYSLVPAVTAANTLNPYEAGEISRLAPNLLCVENTVRPFIGGAGVDYNATVLRMNEHARVFAVLFQIVSEAAVLVAANPGTRIYGPPFAPHINRIWP